jgi:hypothetical protein
METFISDVEKLQNALKNKDLKFIKEQVKMPSLSTDRRFQKICINNKWEVIDTHNENKTRYKGAYEDVMIACHNLNKKFYRDGVI